MDPGGGSGGSGPPYHIWRLFGTKILSSTGSYIAFYNNWLIFLMKRALYFITKLNSRDIKNCYCFWVTFYDNLCSHSSRYFPRQWRQPAFTDWENVFVSVRSNLPQNLPEPPLKCKSRKVDVYSKSFACSTRGGFARPRLPEVSLTLRAPVSTYKFSIPISIHFLKSVERIQF